MLRQNYFIKAHYRGSSISIQDTVKRAKTSEDIKMMEAPVENVKTEGMKEDEEAVKNECTLY